jgi:hypothetical protein
MTRGTSVLVLGAGELGLEVIRNLAQREGVTLSVLLRPSTIASTDPAKRREVGELRSLEVALVPGDLVADSIDVLAEIFVPFDTVIGCTGFVAGRGTQLKLARAALAAGVKRYFPWQFGVDYDAIGRGSAQDLFDEQLDVRDLLRGQDRTEWVIVSTGMFTSFLFEPSFGVVDLDANIVHALGGWDVAVTVTTPVDIGRLTAEIVLTEPRIANQVVYTAGDTISYGELAGTVDAILGRTVRREAWSIPELKAELTSDPDNPIRKYRVVFAEGRGVAWDKSRSLNAARGIDVTSVEAWIRQHLATSVRPA